jgi:hypothetical protein
MEKPPKRRKRINTSNYRVVTSRAIVNVDYDPERKIIEVQFTTGQIYHYENARAEQWSRILSLIPRKKGLGGYINTEFKRYFETGPGDYYQLIEAG